MKRVLVALLIAAMPAAASAQVWVNGYTKSDGTYVQGYYRSAPNNTTSDNYSTKGNVNPYTGQAGTKPDTGYHAYTPAPIYTPPAYTPPPTQTFTPGYVPYQAYQPYQPAPLPSYQAPPQRHSAYGY